jgi:hypothetical protein
LRQKNLLTKFMSMTYFFSILLLMLCLSCGKAVENNNENQNEDAPSMDGTYMAILVPVNGKVSNRIYGEVKVSKYSDEFKVDVRVSNPPSGILRQSLHTGSKCPKVDSDRNQDGYLDSSETLESVGYTIVPFDGNLNSQTEGNEYHLTGNYHYQKNTSYYLMLSDLHNYDEVSNDSIVKLSDDDLPLERRVVAVYVESSKFASDMLIACGVLTRVSTDENTSNEDTWTEPSDNSRKPRPRPRPRPTPRPDPRPEPEPQPDDNSGDSWWERWRDRWERWRDRWGGGNSDNSREGGRP